MNKYFLIKLVVFWWFSAQSLHAQQNLGLSGKIINKNDQTGVPFVHVFIESTGIGTISNLYGDFTLSYPAKYKNKNLIVSSLGYKSRSISLSDLGKSPVRIRLEEDIVELETVVVRPEDPVELLREALNRIPENYDTSAQKLSGYYKLSIALEDKNVKYTEAFIDVMAVEKPGFFKENRHRHDSIFLREVRTKPSELNDWKLESMLAWEGSMYYIQHRDIVETFRAQRSDYEEFLSRNIYELEKMININGRRTYMIRLKPRKNKRKAQWDGYIYIDEETKAFVKLDLTSSPRQLKKLKSSMSYIITSKLYNVKYDAGEWKESLYYKRIGDKWYFTEVNASKQFLISSKKRGLDHAPVQVDLQYRVDKVERNFRFPDSTDFLQNKDGFWEIKKYIDERYRQSFWEDFDQQRGVARDTSSFAIKDRLDIPETTYKFTKLDTLQGALTPLRTCFDVGFYHLNIELLPDEEIILGNSLIRFRAAENTRKIQVDLYAKMSVDSIIHRGRSLNYEREYNAVYIDFEEEITQGDIEEVNVYFSGRPVDYNPNIPMYGSFIWAEDIQGNPWLQAICQGYGASGWWPNKDHLSDEPDSAMISVTVPDNLEVVSNGRLRNKLSLDGDKTRFDWFVSYPINNYNLILNVGKYEHLNNQYTSSTSDIDLDYYVLKHQAEDVKKKVEIVKPMLATYEKYFGPYPFPKDGFKLVSSLHPMEHQSCVSIGADYFDSIDEVNPELDKINVSKGQVDFSIVLHESAHEWWGNNISCTDNAELWIHEAFATYAESLYIEDHYGREIAQDYINAMKPHVFNNDPIIGKMNVNHIHYEIQDMYTKGALMLNTLRHTINNDSLWFSILKGLQYNFKYQSINTDQVVRYVNELTGRDYTGFFDQYLRHTTIPKLQIDFEQVEHRTIMKYRWVVDVEHFDMTIKYSIGKEQPKVLYPTKEWQVLELSASPTEFKVDTKRFYFAEERLD